MLRHRLKTGDLASRSERNVALISTLSEAFRDRHKEYTNLRILAANEDTLLATKSSDHREYLSSSLNNEVMLYHCCERLSHAWQFAPFGS